MAMRQARLIEEDLVSSGMHPLQRRAILEIVERIRVQHQQVMQLASMFDKMTDTMQELANKLSALGVNLEKSGVMEKIKDSMQDQDDDPDDTHTHSRRLKH